MALDNAAAQNEALRILNNNDQSQLLEEKLKRLVDLANLHDGDREQRDDVFTSLPEGASNNRQNYEQQAPSGNSSLPDASLDRPWISSALSEQQNPTLTSEGIPHNPERSGSIGSDSDLGTQDFQTPFALDSQIDGPAVLGAERPGGGEGNVPFPGPSGGQTPDHTPPGGSPKSNRDPHSPGETPKPGPGPSPDRATITVAGAPKDLTVDETDLTTDATANFGAYFSATYGVNGKGIGGMTFKIGVVQPGTDSGLVDEATGQHLLLFHNSDGSISGRTPGGLEGFHITTDQVGNIELDQLRSIVHPDPNNTDESITLKNPNLITITGTAVSAGGDSASATIGIGQVFHFKDDAPSLQLTTNGHPPVLGVDETFIGQAGGTSTQSFASLFSGSHQFGADGSGTFKTSYELNLSKDGVFSGLIDSETGERILLHVNTQNGNITGILENTGKEALKISTTQAGDITFTSERAVIHPDPTNTDEEIHLSPGLLALRRTDTITDKDGDSATSSAQIDLGSSLTIHDDAPSITPPATTGTIPDFVVTEQGGINGAASHNFSSNFSTGNSNAVDQNASLTTAFSFSLNPNGVDSGLQDHNGNHIFLFQSGDNVVGLVGNSNSPNPNGSNALQITLDPTSGQATFSSSQDLQHSDPSKSGTGDQLSFKPNVLSITRTDTITDADGDHASASNSLDISGAFLINDTAPSITPPATTGTIPDFVVTEQGGINGAASHNFSSNFSTGNSNAVDQNASLTTAFSFSLNPNGVDSGLQDHNGNHIFLFQSGDNVVGLVGNSNSPNPNGSNALQITLDPTSGQATFSSSQDLQHSDPSKSGTGDQLSFKPNVLSITRTDTITDADGDHASASNSLDISGAFLINDTAPSITPPATTGTIPDFVVTEQGGINGAASHNFSSNFSTGNSNAVDQNASLTTAFSFSLNPNGVDSGLQDHNGNHIFLFQSGDNVVGLVGNSNSPNPNGSNALQITLDPTSGQATFSSSQDLQHSDPSKSGTGDQLSFKPNVLSITRTDTITDADGDHASASNSLDISGAFLINDTAPSITPPATTGTIPDFVVTEQGGINGAASHNFSSNFSTGNSNAVDQNASLTTAFSFSLNPNGVDSGLQDHNGNHIFLFQSGDNVVGLVGNSNSPNPNGSNALQITLDPTSGQATFSSSQDLQHSDPSKSGTGDQLSFKPNVLSITRTDTITDADGDHASASNSLDISGAFLINDTAPSITPPATTGTIPDFVVTEQGGINGAASHNFSSNFSTGNSNAVDQNASLTTAFSFSLNPNGVDSGLQDHNGNHIFLFQSGDNVVGLVGNSNSPNPNGSNALQITLDPTSGQATFSSSQDLQHSDPSKSGTGDQLSFKPNVLSITRTDTITDADGDHASASNSLDISGAFLINDTAPSITPPATTGTIPDFVVTEQGGINGAASHNFSSNFSTGNSNAVDQNASLTTAFSFSLNPNGVDSGLQDHNGNHIFLFQSGDNVVGLVGNSNSPNPNGSNALQITLDPTSGQATFSSSQDLQHSDPSKSGTGDQLSFKPNVLSITRTDTITDADGDHASASNSLDISGAFLINDTAPSITPPATTGTIPDFVVTEQGGINGAASHNFSSNFSTGNSNAVDQNASLTTAFSFSLNPNGVDSGLQDHNGNHIFLFQSGDNVVGLVGNSNSPNPNGSNALQITLDPTSGQATFSSSQDLQHSDPSKSGTGDQLSFKPNVLSITRTDTITDADGDHASASNSLDISGAFLINDTAPSITPPATTGTIPDFVVTEQGGINGAASHNFSSNFSTGNSNAVDQNASLTTAFSFSLNPNGVDSGLQDHNGNHIFLFQSGDNVVGLVGNSNSPNPNGSNALQITLDPTSGQATFSSSQDLQHSDPSKSGTGDQLSFKPNVLSITRTDTITDADGDHASASNSLDISGAFLINDTAPSITPPATTGTIPDFVVTEQGGINGAASHNFSSNFSTGNSNAVDQNASLTTAFSFSLNPNGVDSGLQDHNGNHIFLFQSGDNVVGLVGNSNSPNPNGSNALQITLDPTSGQATFSSSQDLQHSDPSKSGTGDQLSFKPNVLSITRTDTITDADGDHASASNSLDISGAFLINDTAPSITPPATTGTIPDFVVTEQGGINGAASHNFSSNFSTGNSNAVDQNASLTTAFSFSLNPNGVDSGLQDHNGNHIFLFQSGDNVVGLVGNSNSPNPNGSNALQITLDPTSGQATFSSSQDLQHSDPSKSGTGDQLSFKPNVLSITRTDTITDADGDHASASNSLDISGAFLINDTAPSITPPATTGTIPDFVVTEQGGINGAASHNFSSNFSTGNSNAVDQNASLTTAFSFSLNPNGVDSGLQDHNGNHIFLFQSGDNVVGLVGNSNSPNPNGSNALQITLDPTSGQATFSSSQDLQHSDPSKSGTGDQLSFKPNVLSITRTDTITDADGDHASASNSLDISGAFLINDTAPSITPPATTGTIPDFVVTEQGGINGAASHNFSSNFSTGNSNAVDQNASLTTAFSFSLNPNGVDSGLQDHNGNHIFLFQSGDNVVGLVGNSNSPNPNGSNALQITLDPTSGQATFSSSQDLQHSDPSKSGTGDQLSFKPNVLSITRTDTITDADGDHASASNSLDISGAFLINDTAPSVDPAKVGTLSPLVTDDDTLNLDATTSLSSLFSSAFTPGADGTQSIAYSLALSAQDANSGLHALNPSGGPNQGPEILLHRDANGVIHGYPSGGKSDGSEDLFTITIDGKNNLVLDQIKPIWQDNTSSNNEQTLLTALPNTLKITASITDQDGDSVSTSIDASSGIFAFQDSGPSVDPAKVGTLSPLVTDDDTLNLDATTSLSSLFSSAFTPGADGTQSIAYSLALSAQDANSGLHALNPSGGPNQGPEILLHRDANGVIHGYPSGGKSDGSEDLFTITIDGKNNLVLDQIKPIWQDNTSSNNEQTLLTALPNTLKITASITDQDGDSVSTSIDASSGIFAFQDSGPSVDPAKVGTLSPLVTDDDTLNLDATTSLSSLFSSAFTPGADGTQSIAYSLALSAQDANSGLHALNPSGGPNQGPEILLHRDANGVIHGYPSGGKSDGSEDLFTITIDGKNNLVLDQIKPIWQDNTSSNNEQTLLTALPNTLKITASITDQDGDSVSTSIDASSGIFAFQDSGPSVDPAKVGTLSPLVTDDDTLNLDATTSLSSLFSSAFTPGADGTQSIAYSLALSAQDANSGLHALNPSGGPNQGPEILLHRDANGVIHGYPSGGKSDGSEDLFTITIDGKNNLVLDQIKPIWQDNTSSNNEQTLLTALPNTLKITASITDQDGDSVSTSIDASSGIFAFQDSGPSVDPAKVGTLSPLVTDDDTLNLDATTSLSSLFSSAFTPGADGTQSIAYSLALSAQDANSGLHALNPSGGPNQGPEILLHRDANGVIHGYPSGGKSDGSEDLFTITIDGKNNLVLDQIKPIWQDNTSSNNEQTLLTALPNTLKITASITDQDGDSVSTSIDASSGIFAFQDSGPSVDPAKVGTLSPLVTDDDTLNLDATTSLSSLFSSAFTPGADGTQSIAYSLALSAQDANSGLHALNPSGGPNQGPEILLHRDANGVIHGYPSGGKSDGSEDLFTITIDGKNNLVLDQIKPIWQDNTSSNNEQTLLTALPNTLKITASITDQDGDSVSTSIDASSGIFAFQDSGPSVDPAKVGTLSPLVTDDDTLNLDATTSLSSLFSSAFTPGADGTQSIAYSLALSAQDANSGLHALNPSGGPNQGPEILLHRDANGVIHGYPSGGKSDGSEDLFTITIDGKNNLVLDQIKPIWQDNTSSNNEQTLLTALPNTLKITASITDQDGDSVSTSIDASSGIFAFQDSGPSVDPAKVGTLSPLVTDDDTLNLDATTSLSSLFSSAFTPGADGTQSIAYSLALSAQDANSGLHALNPSGGPNQGPEILLHRDANGVIHGYPSGGKSDGSEDLFTITIDGKNNLVLDQIKPIWQDNTSSNNEQTLLTALPNTLKITASITDQDGDSVSTSIDASSGIFAFQDSGPSVDPAKVGTLSPLVTDDDTLNLDATTSLSSLFSSAFTPGADGTQSIAYSLALSAQDANSGLHALNPSGGPNQGPEILLHRDANGVIHGYPSGGKSDGSEDLFTITIDGKNNLVLDQIKPIWQDNTSSNNEQTLLTALPNTLKITASITDQDGDSVSTSIDASSGIFAFQDSGPSVDPAKVGTLSPLVTDDDTLNLDATTSLSSLFSSAFTPGADGTQSIAYSLALSAQDANSGLHALNPSGGPNQGPEILLHRDANGVIHGYPSGGKSDGSEDLFTITIDGKNNLVLDQIKPIWQDNTSSNNEQTLLTALPNTLKITASITDQDGDSVSTSIDASSGIFAFQDSGPSVDPAKVGTLSPLVTDDDTLNLDATTSLSSLFSSAFTPGADGTQSIAYSLALSAQDANSGLHALNPSGGPNQGPEILLHRDANGVIHGYPSGGKSDGSEDLFTITIDGKNNLVLDQIKPIWQDNTSSNNEQTLLTALPNTLKITASITDQDGDSVSTSIDASSGIFAFQDSGPSVDPAKVGTLSPLVTDDDTLNLDATTSLSSLFSSAFTPGAAGTQSIAYSLALSAQDANSGLHALNPSGGPNQGPEILLHRDANGVIHGYPSGGKSDGSEDLFTITIDGKNNLVLDQIKPIWQDNTSSNNEQTLLTALPNTLKITASITDQDGDSVSTSIDASSGIFAFQDSGPSISMGKVSVSTTQHPQTPLPPSTGTTTTTTTTIFDPHQNLGLVLDYSGSMGWSGHNDPDDARPNSRIHQQLLASVEIIKQAFENAGYKVTTPNGLTHLTDWKLEPLAGHTPGNIHLSVAIFGGHTQTESLTINNPNDSLQSINNILHHGKISGTNHTEAWKAAQNITTSWQQSNISDLHQTKSGAEIKTDTNMLIMTDGETSRGQDMISDNSYVLTTYNKGQHHYGLNNISGWNSSNKADSELKITYTDSAGVQHEQNLTRAQIDGMINDHNHPLGTSHGYSNSRAVQDKNGDIIGWLGFPKVIDPNIHHHHPNPIEVNPLVFTPNEANGITITKIENNKSSGPNDEITSIMSSGFNSQGAQLSHNLDQALLTLDQQVGHEKPNVIGVGIVDPGNTSIGSQLQTLFNGSLPAGSSFTQVSSQTNSNGSLSQQIQTAVQQSFQNVDVHFDFNFDPGSDDDLAAASSQNNGVVEFTLEQKSTLLGTGGHSPVQAFAATFGGNQNTSNVKDLGNGEFEIKINGLGTFTINTGNTVLSSGSHNGTIDFKPNPGVSIGRNLDLTLSIKDADGDTKSVNFTLPKFNTNVTPSQTQHDEPDQNGFTADISVIANDALTSAQADSDTEATLAALISLGLKTDHDDVDLSQSTQEDGSQLITRTIHTDQGDILETITDPQNGNAPSLQLDVSGLDADTQKDLQATIQAQTSSSASESKPGQLDSVLGDATQSPPAIDGHSLADAISDLQQLDADAIAALNGQDTSTNSADGSSLSGDAALTPLPQDPSDVPVTSMEDAFASPQQTDDDVMAPPDLSDTSQTAAPLPDNSTQDQDLSLLNT